MRSPVFVVCQGRTGGTMLSDLLARLPGTRYLLEPLHPRLLKNVRQQPERTAEKLNQPGLQPFPNRGYLDYDFRDLVDMHCTHQSRPETIRRWLRFLADGAAQDNVVPVFKVCRLFGKLHLIREEFPGAAVVHLWRNPGRQRASYLRVGFPGDYFGDCSAYGLPPAAWQASWDHAKREAEGIADVSVQFEVLQAGPVGVLSYILRDGLGFQEQDVIDFYATEMAGNVWRRG